MKNIKTFEQHSEKDSFKLAAHKLIDDTKSFKKDYSEKTYNKIIGLEKLIDGSEDDREKFVKSIIKLLRISKWDLTDTLFRYS